MEAKVSIAGAEPWSARGSGVREGVGVVVTHGFTANPVGTRPIGQLLAAEGYTVEVPCLPGHGTNFRDLARTGYDDWYEALDHVVDVLARGCDRIVLVGHSTGGTLSVDVASRRPSEIAGVVAINPLIAPPAQPIAKLLPVLKYLVPYLPRDLAGLPTDDIAKPGVTESAYGTGSLRTAETLVKALPGLRERLPAMTAPLLVIWSPEDHTVHPSSSKALQELVSSEDVSELVCDRSYHLPQIDYDAERVAAAITAFVARVTGT
jgi:carboxylesterase